MIRITDKELLDVYKLKNITRYNNKLVLTKESVAEHSFYVALLSLMICDRLGLPSNVQYQCIVKSLLHDMPEIELNDITHDVKEKLNLRGFLEKFELEYISTNFLEHEYLFKEKNKAVDAIVDLADILSVKQYALTEILVGNKSDEIEAILNETEKREKSISEKLEKYLEEETDYEAK